ncbi:MAG: tetratricopeptide repeat protein [Candidatus Parcubacteria bacterium]|nr:tetratricopeptide repeat protein [Candidatus Parcubacteria bacterium]
MQIIYISIRNFFIYLKDFREIFIEKLIRLTIYVGAFLLPLFFIPISGNFLEYSKVLLFYALVILGLLGWLLKVFLTKKINLQARFLDIPLILFLLVCFLASFFSVDRYQSFLGLNFNLSASFVTIVFFVIFYFLTSRFINTTKQVKTLFGCLLFSLSLFLINNILPFFSIKFLPALLGNSISSLYFSLLLASAISGFYFLTSSKKIAKIIFIILALFFLLIIFIINNQQLLIILILAFFLFILFGSLRPQYFSNKLVITSTILLFLTVLFLILPIRNWTRIIAPLELKLPDQFGWQITKANLADNLLLGVGPQNFAYSFYKYKPALFNQTNLWQLSFEKNSFFWLEILNNLGILGMLLIIALMIKYFSGLFSFIKRLEVYEKTVWEKFILVLIESIIFISLIIFGFLVNFDFLLLYFFFLFLSVGVGLLKSAVLEKIFVNKNILNLFIYAILIVLVCLGFYGVKIIWADVLYAQALAKDYKTATDYQWGENKLQEAIRINPLRKDYLFSLASLQASELTVLQQAGSQDEFQNLLKKLSNNLGLLSQNDSQRLDYYLAWQQIYNSLKNIGLTDIEAQGKINDKLIDLDSKNPEHYIDRALFNFDQYLLIKNGTANVQDKDKHMSDLLQAVKADLEKSLEYKSDYILGFYNLGLYYQEIGDKTKGLENIEKAFNLDHGQKLVVLTLKKLYLNEDKVDKAIEVLNKYLAVNPKDNEVRLELAKVYKNNNKLDLAKQELNKILEIEPNNTTANDLLSQIK